MLSAGLYLVSSTSLFPWPLFFFCLGILGYAPGGFGWPCTEQIIAEMREDRAAHWRRVHSPAGAAQGGLSFPDESSIGWLSPEEGQNG
jgi:hypothetical protein